MNTERALDFLKRYKRLECIYHCYSCNARLHLDLGDIVKVDEDAGLKGNDMAIICKECSNIKITGVEH